MKKNIIIFLISALFLHSCNGFDDHAVVTVQDDETTQVGFAITRADVAEDQTFGFYAYTSINTATPEGQQPKNLNNGWGTYYYTAQYPALVPCIVNADTGVRTTGYNVSNAMEITSGTTYIHVTTPGLPMVIYDGSYQVRYPRTTPLKILKNQDSNSSVHYCTVSVLSNYQICNLSSFVSSHIFVEQRSKFMFRFIQGADSPIKISDCYVLNAGTYAYLHPNTRVITITGQGNAGSEVPCELEDKGNSSKDQVSFASKEDGSQDVYLFPGDYTATYLSDLKLSFKLKIGDDAERTMELPISMKLDANNRYIFSITVSTQFITLTCQKAEWDATISMSDVVGETESIAVGTFPITDWEDGGSKSDVI